MPHHDTRAVLATLGLALLSACGSTSGTAVPISPTATTLTCTSSGVASPDWSVPQPGSTPMPPIVSATASGDTLTLTFRQGTPAFSVAQTPTAHFLRDPSGLPLDLSGTAGVVIKMTGFRGDVENYTGQKIFASGGPLLLQIAEVGDFEGIVGWAGGLSKPGCANVTASGSTLTIHYIPAQ
jgi:hypothetical protein